MVSDLQWDLGCGVQAAFSTAADGDQRDPDCRGRWLATLGVPVPVAVPEQVHGSRLCPASPGWHRGVDGLVLDAGVPSAVIFGADCPGLVLLGARHVVVAHCGWRGIAAGMVAEAVAAFRAASGVPPTGAFIGPSITGTWYEVDAPVLQAFAWPEAGVIPGAPGKAWLDLPIVITELLADEGIGTVRVSGVCTAQDPRLHSYRHQGPGLVQGLAVWRTPPTP